MLDIWIGWGRKRMTARYWWGNLLGNVHLIDERVDGVEPLSSATTMFVYLDDG